MQVAKLFFLIAFFSYCNNIKEKQSENFVIEKNKAKSTYSSLTCRCFDQNKKDEQIPCFLSINGILFDTIEDNDVLVVNALPHRYEVNATYVGYKRNNS